MYNEAQKKATAKYMKEHLDDIKIRVPKGERDRYKAAAAHLGVSLNQLFVNAVEEIIADRLVGVDLSNAPVSDTSESTE